MQLDRAHNIIPEASSSRSGEEWAIAAGRDVGEKDLQPDCFEVRLQGERLVECLSEAKGDEDVVVGVVLVVARTTMTKSIVMNNWQTYFDIFFEVIELLRADLKFTQAHLRVF